MTVLCGLITAAIVVAIVTAALRHSARRAHRPMPYDPQRTTPAAFPRPNSPAPAQAPPPMGWHPDPTGRHQYRFWDGERWTDQICDDGRSSVDPPSTPTRYR